MSVVLNPPNQLGFARPLTEIRHSKLTIQNPHNTPVMFKVKTTAPKQYCVRPNQGEVPAGGKIDVDIVLQPLPEDPPPHAKCKDKFLVQSIAYTGATPEMAIAEKWTEMDRLRKKEIQEQKIRCAYLPAPGGANPNGIPEEGEEGSPIDHSHMDQSYHNSYSRWTEHELDPTRFRNGGYTAWELPAKKPPVVQRQPVVQKQLVVPPQMSSMSITLPLVKPGNVNTAYVVYPVHGIYTQAEASPMGKQSYATNGDKDLPATPMNPAAAAAAAGAAGMGAGALGGAAMSSPTAAGAPVREIPQLSAADVQGAGAPTNAALTRGLDATTSDHDKYQAALQEIDRLKAQLAEAQGPTVTGLRKRGGAGVADGSSVGAKTSTAVRSAGSTGVPLEVCAGLVFAVFVMTYLFF